MHYRYRRKLNDCEVEDKIWRRVDQLVKLKLYRNEVLHLAHGSGLAGQIRVKKTLSRIWSVFYWPWIPRNMAEYCKTCALCQTVGKPNQPIPVAPLNPFLHFGEHMKLVRDRCLSKDEDVERLQYVTDVKNILRDI